MSFSVTSLEMGGGFRMVHGPLGIQEYQSSCREGSPQKPRLMTWAFDPHFSIPGALGG